jgi:uncharacterized protein (TIGR03435 family)
MHRAIVPGLGVLLSFSVIMAATQNAPLAFEVASVKPNTAGPPPSGVMPRSYVTLDAGDDYPPNGGFLSATNWPLSVYIEFAYKLTSYQYRALLPQMPKWAISPMWFDIEARADGNRSKDQMRLMMQSLLAERFKLAVHWEKRQLPVFDLVLSKPGKTGSGLRVHLSDEPCSATEESSPAAARSKTADGQVSSDCDFYNVRLGSGRVHVRILNETMKLIAGRLTGSTNYVDRPVIDRTGLDGRFDFSLDFTPDASDRLPQDFLVDATGPTFLEALEEQAGLRLIKQTGPVDVLIIDHAEKPDAN